MQNAKVPSSPLVNIAELTSGVEVNSTTASEPTSQGRDDCANPAPGAELEEFELDDIEIIESKVFA